MKTRKLNSGRIKCLKCGDKFNSKNKTTNRICGSCRRLNRKMYFNPTLKIA